MNIYLVTTLIDWKEGRVNTEAETAKEAMARTEGAIKAVKVGARVFDTSEQEQDKEREEMYHTLIEDTGNNY
jgi:phosphoribosylformylglycinamidine (FGAM) synthase PurS component